MTPLFWEYCQAYELDTTKLAKEVFHHGSISHIETISPEIKTLFRTALEISPEQHLQVQAAFQHHVDNAVSKTINMPKDSTREEVSQTYWRAWELRLKGVTIFRYGSKHSQVLEVGTESNPHWLKQGTLCGPGECRI